MPTVKPAIEPCPRCGSRNVEARNPRSELTSAVGTIVIGALLTVVFPPLLYLLIPAGLYLIATSVLTKPGFACLDCRHKWPATEAPAPKGPSGDTH